MKKILFVPDSFKGTMSSSEICSIMARAVRQNYPEAEVVSIPVADGGEGTVDAFLAVMGGEKRRVITRDLFFEEISSFYGVVDNGKTAVIEMAACAGLPLAERRPDPQRATTYGVGQLIAHAAQSGCRKIILGLGGSATNDGGAGAAAALGIRFFNAERREFVPAGGTLSEIAEIDLAGRNKSLDGVELIAMCDVKNPLYGSAGAACVFAPQKGADPATVEILDRGLRHFAEKVERVCPGFSAERAGMGAAGGMGYGAAALLGFSLHPGIETILDTVGFDRLLQGADCVLTGEGRIDRQSLHGKVISGVARRTKAAGVPLLAIAGDLGDRIEDLYEMGVSGMFSINRIAAGYPESRKRAPNDLFLTVDNLMRLMKRMGL